MSTTNGSGGQDNPPPPGANSADVTMQSLEARFAAMEATVERVLGGRQTFGDPAMEDRNPHHLPPKPTAARLQSYGNLPGENFISWRSHFMDMVGLNRWNTAEAKSFAFNAMRGRAQEFVMDISTKIASESLEDFLNHYQARFLPAARSQMLRAQFAHVRQQPNESVQSLHSRMRVLYLLAYPDVEDQSRVMLIERFISALNNRDVQNFVRRRKPRTFEEALEVAAEETSFVLLDLASHTPGGLQQPTQSDTSVLAAIGARSFNPQGNRTSDKRCFYCEEEGHVRGNCPARLRDFLKSRRPPGTNQAPLRRTTATAPNRRGGTSMTTGLGRPGGYSNASRRQAMASAEARDFPSLSSRYGGTRPRRRVATIEEECPEEAVAALEADADILDTYDFSTVDDQTIAALYEEMAAEDSSANFAEEEDFPEGQ